MLHNYRYAEFGQTMNQNHTSFTTITDSATEEEDEGHVRKRREKGEKQDKLELEDADGWCIVSVTQSKSYFPQK